MCDNGFRNYGARPMGENLRSKQSGQRRTIQSARRRSGGASNPPAADAATPLFQRGWRIAPFEKGGSELSERGICAAGILLTDPWGAALRAELWTEISP